MSHSGAPATVHVISPVTEFRVQVHGRVLVVGAAPSKLIHRYGVVSVTVVVQEYFGFGICEGRVFQFARFSVRVHRSPSE